MKPIGRFPKSSVRPTYIGNMSESDVLSEDLSDSDSRRTMFSDDCNPLLNPFPSVALRYPDSGVAKPGRAER